MTPAPAHQVHCEYDVGDVIGTKYLLRRVLGEGGMGSVWLARNKALDVDVAIKLIRNDLGAPEGAARLLQEARAAARLGHPSIVRVFDFGNTERGDPFIVMEMLDGESLGDCFERRGRLDALAAVRTVLPVASALESAHAHGIVHRDMKPDNVVMVSGEAGAVIPKVVDFGIAKLWREEALAGLTQPGTILGSPEYMAPEQARGRSDIDHRADVWALAVMLYEAITGHRPFTGANYNAVMMAVIDDEPVPTIELAAGDEALWALLQKGLAKDAADRWPTMRAFGVALAAWAMERGATDDIAGNALNAHWGPAPSQPPSARGSESMASADPSLGRLPGATLPPPSASPAPPEPRADGDDVENAARVLAHAPSSSVLAERDDGEDVSPIVSVALAAHAPRPGVSGARRARRFGLLAVASLAVVVLAAGSATRGAAAPRLDAREASRESLADQAPGMAPAPAAPPRDLAIAPSSAGLIASPAATSASAAARVRFTTATPTRKPPMPVEGGVRRLPMPSNPNF
jgi:serine/threonine-protein kinase